MSIRHSNKKCHWGLILRSRAPWPSSSPPFSAEMMCIVARENGVTCKTQWCSAIWGIQWSLEMKSENATFPLHWRMASHHSVLWLLIGSVVFSEQQTCNVCEPGNCSSHSVALRNHDNYFVIKIKPRLSSAGHPVWKETLVFQPLYFGVKSTEHKKVFKKYLFMFHLKKNKKTYLITNMYIYIW